LTAANLTDANLTDADLTAANLTRANLTYADLTDANLTDVLGASAPVIDNIDAKILAAIESPGCSLDMTDWHTCETTHCRAGWAVNLAGPAGKMLEDRIGPAAAGALIYAASRPGEPIPNFYATNEDAMEDLRECAFLQTNAAPQTSPNAPQGNQP
ncbi:MAG TPA: pentapeptide repeat-containing protein, partial [Gemmataceae bacterium]|nr:pentapeptide repeat-containing protein [Gemmataceae bacterium]